MNTASKVVWAIVYIGLVGALLMGVITHASQFATAFNAVGNFFLNEMNALKG